MKYATGDSPNGAIKVAAMSTFYKSGTSLVKWDAGPDKLLPKLDWRDSFGHFGCDCDDLDCRNWLPRSRNLDFFKSARLLLLPLLE